MTSAGAATLTYDNNGNLLGDGTNTYAWDRANRMRAVNEGDVSQRLLSYDGLGNLVQQVTGTINPTTHSYLVDVNAPLPVVVRELSGSYLTHTQLRLVDEYIYAHLDRKISLADLATCLHLSVPHFERMFRMTTHQPPYRYVLELRLEQARVLLQRTRLPVAEVALQCGFSSQSHFTAHFSRHTGVSPARFARGARE